MDLSLDPFEQRLRDEVVYLHSLWHQGPPRNRKPFSNPNPTFRHNPLRNLLPFNPKPFKKIEQKKNRKKRPESDIEWPCEEPIANTSPARSGWPALKAPSAEAAAQPASAEDLARFAAAQIQQNGVKACQEFFASNAVSDDEDSEEEEDLVGENGGCEESKEFKFFLRVFAEDHELRVYYEKNFVGGEFCCFVCGGIGEKVGKRFRDCVALVQHTIAIAKTKKRRAHRAYGQVICKVLGWDIDRLPTIVSSLSELLGRSMAKSGELQGNGDGVKEGSDGLKKNMDSANVDNGEAISNGDSDVCGDEVLPDKAVPSSNGDIVEWMDYNSTLKQGDAIKNTEDLYGEVSEMMDMNAGGTTNCPEDGVGSVVNGMQNVQL